MMDQQVHLYQNNQLALFQKDTQHQVGAQIYMSVHRVNLFMLLIEDIIQLLFLRWMKIQELYHSLKQNLLKVISQGILPLILLENFYGWLIKTLTLFSSLK